MMLKHQIPTILALGIVFFVSATAAVMVTHAIHTVNFTSLAVTQIN